MDHSSAKWLKTWRREWDSITPFLLSRCDTYTSAIIAYRSAVYKRFELWATVSMVSPVRCSSAQNGISGISRKALLGDLESPGGFVLCSLSTALLDRRVSSVYCPGVVRWRARGAWVERRPHWTADPHLTITISLTHQPE
jgi:hypothetical protein